MASTRSTTPPDHPGGRGNRTDWSALAWASLPIGLIFLAHVWFGANSSFAALTLAAAEGLVLMVLSVRREAKDALARIVGLRSIACLFLVTLATAAWSLSSVGPGGAHPIWSYGQATGSLTIDRSAVAIELIKLIGLGCAFLIGAILGGSERLFRAARIVLTLAGGAFALWALLLFVGGGQLKGGRLMGAFGSANAAATVLGMLVLMALPWIFERRSPARRSIADQVASNLPALGLLTLILGAFVTTASRWGSVSLAAGLLAFVTLLVANNRMKVGHATVFASGFVLMGLPLILLKGGLLVERFGTTVLSADARTTMVTVHWPMFLQSPFFGYGLGTFAQLNHLALDARNYEDLWGVRDLHNAYIQWLEEGGLLSAVAMFLTITIIIVFALRGGWNSRRNFGWIAAITGVNLVVLVHSLSDFALQVPSIASFWALLLGMQLSIGSIAHTTSRRA